MVKRKSLFRLLPSLAALLIAPLAVPAQASTNLLNLYVGASLGHASLRAKDSSLIAATYRGSLGGFDRGDFAYQIMAGVRALDLLGAEIDYWAPRKIGSVAFSDEIVGVIMGHEDSIRLLRPAQALLQAL